MKKIAIVTDAWHPQINGVVTTLTRTINHLQQFGYQVLAITPELFTSVPCPSYNEISLALTSPRSLERTLSSYGPNSIHIATEGPLGWAARSVCKKHNFSFSTSYHTRFPEYVRLRWPIPLKFTYRIVRSFHQAADRTMVATRSLMEELSGRGFNNLVHWSRGVDTDLFKPLENKQRNEPPVFIYLGRVAVEKNIEAFLSLDLPGRKRVIGDGPAREELSRKYPDTDFVGYKTGQDLVDVLCRGDVMVFPSLTDTFGVVMLEAMASGLPVAAFPVTGPSEIVKNGINGYLDNDLQQAAIRALDVTPAACRDFAMNHTWESCSKQFLSNLNFQPCMA